MVKGDRVNPAENAQAAPSTASPPTPAKGSSSGGKGDGAKKLNKGGTMTYAGWCVKHDFDYCKISDGIPKQWYNGKQ